MSDVRDAGFDDLLAAVERDDGFYLRCPNGHGFLPPRRVCPDCGARDLSETPLPDVGTVLTYTVISVATPDFAEDTPYTTAIADFGDVRVTGVVDAPAETVETGMTVGLSVGHSKTTGERLLQFVPR